MTSLTTFSASYFHTGMSPTISHTETLSVRSHAPPQLTCHPSKAVIPHSAVISITNHDRCTICGCSLLISFMRRSHFHMHIRMYIWPTIGITSIIEGFLCGSHQPKGLIHQTFRQLTAAFISGNGCRKCGKLQFCLSNLLPIYMITPPQP